MDRILTIIEFGAEKYTDFWVSKKRNLSIRYTGTENITAVGLLIASEKQC